ncbi:MAG TPA: hypothetical protein PLZ57_05165 [Pseudobdellovibrionaceae bacterium]|jgi:hypothetical protein|nr:hypothetical protein [Pseudobdellovibrionaceae bacterium]
MAARAKKSEKVQLSKDGSSISFVQSDSLPTSTKKFRQSPEIEGFYRFVYENDLRVEAYQILSRILIRRKFEREEAARAARAAKRRQS